jgi:hypothetical protein
MYALKENKVEHLQLLIHAKADVTQESLGTTPLRFALFQQSDASIEFLKTCSHLQGL